MLKNAIIIILSLLLIIIIYAYLCLSNSMQNYQKERLTFVMTKQEEIKRGLERKKKDAPNRCTERIQSALLKSFPKTRNNPHLR